MEISIAQKSHPKYMVYQLNEMIVYINDMDYDEI